MRGRGRPQTRPGDQRAVTIWIDRSIHLNLRLIAAKRDCTVSDLLREGARIIQKKYEEENANAPI